MGKGGNGMYDPLDLSQKGCFIIVTGVAGSGKSHMAKFLVWKWWSERKFDYAFCFTGTSYSGDTAQFLDQNFIKPVTLNGLVNFYNSVKRLASRGKTGLLILDDIAGRRRVFENDKISQLWSNFRHDRLIILVCTQKPTQITTNMRINASKWVIMDHANNKKSIKYLLDEAIVGDESQMRRLLRYVNDKDYYRKFGLVSDKWENRYILLRAPSEIPYFFIGLPDHQHR